MGRGLLVKTVYTAYVVPFNCAQSKTHELLTVLHSRQDFLQWSLVEDLKKLCFPMCRQTRAIDRTLALWIEKNATMLSSCYWELFGRGLPRLPRVHCLAYNNRSSAGTATTAPSGTNAVLQNALEDVSSWVPWQSSHESTLYSETLPQEGHS